MKGKKSIYTIICLITAGLFAGGVYSQDNQNTQPAADNTQKSQQDNGDKEKLIGTYLDIAHARDIANELDERLKNDIYKLQVVVANFGTEDQKSKLKSIVSEHIRGKKELFKRQYLRSKQTFLKVKKDVHDLFNVFSDMYEKKANDILSRCAETLVDKEIGIGSTRDAVSSENAARTSKKITENRIKLVVAYDQLNMADHFQFEERLSDSITHYRLAKLYGVSILVDLADTESEKDKLRSEFKVDLADGENLISK